MGNHETEKYDDFETIEGESVIVCIDGVSKIEEMFGSESLSAPTNLEIEKDVNWPRPTKSMSVELLPLETDIDGATLATRSISTTLTFPKFKEIPDDALVSFITNRLHEETGIHTDFYPTIHDGDHMEHWICAHDEYALVFQMRSKENELSLRAYSEYDDVPDKDQINRRKLQLFYIASTLALDALASQLPNQEMNTQRTLIRISPPEINEEGLEQETDETNEPEDAPGKELELWVGEEEAPIRELLGRPFDTIGGLTLAKEKLLEIGLAWTYPELAKEYDIQPSHFVLHGPPGTGKTSLITAFAEEFDAELVAKPSTTIVNAYLGKSATNLADAFKEATDKAEKQRVLLFFDEIDSLIGNNSKQHREYGQVVNTFKQELDNLAKSPHCRNVIVAAATNADIQDLEPAIVRSGRIEPIPAPAPNEKERIDIWSRLIYTSEDIKREIDAVQNDKDDDEELVAASKLNPSRFDKDIDIGKLAKLTEGKTGADFVQILKRIRVKKFRQAVGLIASGRQIEHDENPHVKLITQVDIEDAIRTFGVT